MENKQQTAVDWFYQRILAKDTKKVYEQAKAMEQFMIIDAYDEGFSVGLIYSEPFIEKPNGEKYYNYTYGTDKTT